MAMTHGQKFPEINPQMQTNPESQQQTYDQNDRKNLNTSKTTRRHKKKKQSPPKFLKQNLYTAK